VLETNELVAGGTDYMNACVLVAKKNSHIGTFKKDA
jgi:hypothetical protein